MFIATTIWQLCSALLAFAALVFSLLGLPTGFLARPTEPDIMTVRTDWGSLNPLTADLKDLQIFLQRGTLTSVDLVHLYSQQIQKHDGYLRAMINYHLPESALKSAKILDTERTKGHLRGPLHGIPIIIKDNIDTHPDLGFRTTLGSYAFVDSPTRKSAKIVDQLIAAGAIILGKANLSELSNYKGSNITSGWSAVGGQVQSAYVRGDVNPDDGKDGHSNPSGSSAGSAVAVSAGYSPFSIGTETDGSLIVPAGRAALYTIKPTIGLVSGQGIAPVSHHFDSAGPLAKSPYAIASLLDALVDEKQRPTESYTNALSATWDNIRVAALDPKIWKLPDTWCHPVQNATEQMEREFHDAYAKIKSMAKSFVDTVDMIQPAEITLHGQSCETAICDADFAKELPAYMQTRAIPTVSSIEDLIEFNIAHADLEIPAYAPNQDTLIRASKQNLTNEEYDEFLHHLRKSARDENLDVVFNEHQVDVILAPSDSLLISYATASAYPISSMPLGYLAYNGRPFGLSAIARSHGERTLIEVMAAWEKTFGPRQIPPLIADNSATLDAN